MTIERINNLHNFGVFRYFNWSDNPNLQDFRRFNLIYGWNGTGKSTISRLLRNLELRQPPEGDVTLKLSARLVTGSEFDQLSQDAIALKVFNREFVEENVFRPNDDNIEPIIVLGKESVEAERSIRELNDERKMLETSIESYDEQLEAQQRLLDMHSSLNALEIKNTIGEKSDSPYRNYHRGNYLNTADQLIDDPDAVDFILDNDQRDNMINLQREDPKPRVEIPDYEPFDPTDLASRASDLLIRTVASQALKALVDDPPLADWIREGLTIHEDRSTDACLYCDRAMPPDRLKALQRHFDDSYRDILAELESTITNCETRKDEVDELLRSLPRTIEFYADLETDYREASGKLVDELDALKSYLDQLVNCLNAKKERVFEPMSLGLEAPEGVRSTLDALVSVLLQHNEACEGFDERVRNARKSLENHFVASTLDEYRDLKEKIRSIQEIRIKYRDRVNVIGNEIAELEQQVLDHGPAAETLNADLRGYLGPGSLQLEVQQRGYRLVRNGQIAHDPSEGEMTAIALLYFLRTLESHGFDLNHGVVVLDDPVSSLDENALFMASAYIRRRTQTAGQLFVLTHNFAFFREMRDWFQNQKGQRRRNMAKRPAGFYMLRTVTEAGTKHSLVCPLDPLIENYDSEYHYLFGRIYDAAGSNTGEMKDSYPLPNMARRLLDAFLAFKQPSDNNLWNRLETLEFDDSKKTQIYRFVNVYSHGNSIGATQHDLTMLAESHLVLSNLLKLIETVDKQHYDGMVGLIGNRVDPSTE